MCGLSDYIYMHEADSRLGRARIILYPVQRWFSRVGTSQSWFYMRGTTIERENGYRKPCAARTGEW